MLYQNNDTLREYLRRGAAEPYQSLADHKSFLFDDAAFGKTLADVQDQHPQLGISEQVARVAFRLLTSGQPPSIAAPVVPWHRRARDWVSAKGVQAWPFVKFAWAVVILGLLLALAARAEPNPDGFRAIMNATRGMNLLPQQPNGLIIQLQDEGTVQATRPAGLVALNCVGSGITCSASGTVWTLNAAGGGGSGCTPPGGSGLLLYDDGAGGCANITKFSTNGTTTLTGAATAILDLSAAATFKPPQVAAPTVEGTSAFNTTTHLPVWGFNGASTATIPKTLANASHKWLNSYDQTNGTLTQTQPDYGDLTGVPSTFAPSAHNLLSASHGDTAAHTVARGDLIAGIGASPAWTAVAAGGTNTYPKWNGSADVVASTLAAAGIGTPTACSNQFVTGFTLNADAAPVSTCTTDTLASAQHANQGTTTTVLHGNGAGNPSFAAVSLSADVTGQLPISGVGSAGLSGTSPVAIASTGVISCATCATGPGSSTSTDLASFNGTGGLALQDSGIASGNVVTAASNGTTKQLCTVAASNKACTWIDFPDVKEIPAANCNGVVSTSTGGAGWSIGTGGTVSCRAGTNNLGGFILITDTSSTFATFQIDVPEDWDTGTLPYIRVKLASTDATNGHTVIPSESVACYVGDGSGTDDIAQNATRSLSTVTLNGNANRFWSTSNLQLNSTDMTNCVGGSTMQVTIGRATDTATNARFYSATMTFPRLLTVQAN